MGFLKFLEGIRNPFFDFIFSAITTLGGETIIIVLAISTLWCLSKKDGYCLLSIGFVGIIINQFLKLIFRIPRPWVLDENFTIVESARKEAIGYSFPSGHTQSSVGTFGFFSLIFSKKWIRYTCLALCVLIPLSRMYLGVHTPLDVFASVFIAIVLIFLFRILIYKYFDSTKKMNVLLSIMLLLSIALVLYVELYNFPSDVDEINYASGLKNAYTIFGAFTGVFISFNIERKFVNFDTSAKWYVQIIKIVLGLLILLGLKEGFEFLFGLIFNSHPVSYMFTYIIVVIFATVIWPIMFPILRKLENVGKKVEISEDK